MTNETLDIRKVPVSELQTRAGAEVVFVAEDTLQPYNTDRMFVVFKEACGIIRVNRVNVDGTSAPHPSSFDIIRKKQLKGRVLYKDSSDNTHVSLRNYTEMEFGQRNIGLTFVRILTEVPELPTEEV